MISFKKSVLSWWMANVYRLWLGQWPPLCPTQYICDKKWKKSSLLLLSHSEKTTEESLISKVRPQVNDTCQDLIFVGKTFDDAWLWLVLLLNYFVSDVLLDGLPDGEGGGGGGGVEGGEEAGEQLRPWGELCGDPGAHGLTICELRPHEEICWDPLDWSFANCAHEENFVETQEHMDHLLVASTHRNSLRPGTHGLAVCLMCLWRVIRGDPGAHGLTICYPHEKNSIETQEQIWTDHLLLW